MRALPPPTTDSNEAAVTAWCPSCRDETDFEQPPCVDHDRGDCPELVCTTCGLALLAFADEHRIDELVVRSA